MQATSGKRVHHGEIHQMDATSNGYVDGGLGALIADTASHGFIMVSKIPRGFTHHVTHVNPLPSNTPSVLLTRVYNATQFNSLNFLPMNER